jgi:hypothetical protein
MFRGDVDIAAGSVGPYGKEGWRQRVHIHGHGCAGQAVISGPDPTILSFSGDAYLNEMGVTNRLKPRDVTIVCKVTADVEDVPDALAWRISTTSRNSSAGRVCRRATQC